MGCSSSATINILLAIAFLATQHGAADQYYFSFQWPGSLCNTKEGCCYPKTGKPATDFTIGGLWLQPFEPMPTYCNNQSVFDISKIQDLKERLGKNWPLLSCPGGRNNENLWRSEWEKYGACFNITQHQYFETALAIKEKLGLLKLFRNAGIEPNGTDFSYQLYNVSITQVIQNNYEMGYLCNHDKFGNPQLLQVMVCAEANGTIAPCRSFLPKSTCRRIIHLPPF